MPRRRAVLAAIAGGATTSVAGCLGGGSDGDSIELRVGSFTTEDNLIMSRFALPVWVENVNDRLDEQTIEYEFLGSGSVGGAGELYDLAAEGVVDMAFDLPAYQGGRMPLNSFIGLPGLFEPNEQGFGAANQALHEMATPGGESDELADEFANVGVWSIMTFTNQSTQLATIDNTISDIDDLDGQVARAGSGPQSSVAEKLGMAAENIPGPDIPSALQNGTVDVYLGTHPAVWANQYYEGLNYCTTNLNLGGFNMSWVMGENTLEGYPAAVSDAMIEAGTETAAVFASNLYSTVEEKVNGSDIVVEETPTDENSQYMIYETDAAADIQDAAGPVVDEWIDEQESEGLPADAVIDTYRSLQEEYAN